MKNSIIKYLAMGFLLLSQGCVTTEVVTANSTPAIQSTEQIPEELLMDIGILPLAPNIPALDEDEKKNSVVPDVRNAESRFMAYHLKDTLELTGNWGQ